MSVSKTWPGGGTDSAPTSYTIPTTAEVNWQALTSFLAALGDSAQGTTFQKFKVRKATTSPVTVAANSDCIVVTDLAAPGAVTVNLPAGADKQVFFIVDGKGDAGTNNITIARNGSDTIMGATTLVLSVNYAAIMLVYNVGDTDWKAYGILDADLAAIANLSTTGLIARTGSGAVAARTLTAGSTKLAVTNGDGVSGNPTVDVTESNLTLDNIGGTLGIAKGGTGQTSQTSAFDALAPTTTKGDLIAHNGTDNVRVAVGTDGYMLVADSAQAAGVAWSPALSSTLQDGRIYVGNASNVATAVTPTGDVTISNAGVTAIAAGAIVDADVNASAAISGSKLQAAGSGNAGAVTTGTQTLAGLKTFSSGIQLPTTGGTAATLDFYEEWSDSHSVSGAFSASGTIRIVRVGKVVTLEIPSGWSGDAGAGGFDYIGTNSPIPSRFRPARQCHFFINTYINNNATPSTDMTIGLMAIDTAGGITIYRGSYGSGGPDFVGVSGPIITQVSYRLD